jgi:DNA-directed RNA polymerase specialized sigma24 family protein
MPVGTVAARLHHGRARLRDRLAAVAEHRGVAAAPG